MSLQLTNNGKIFWGNYQKPVLKILCYDLEKNSISQGIVRNVDFSNNPLAGFLVNDQGFLAFTTLSGTYLAVPQSAGTSIFPLLLD